jgi:hypothetical protein
MTNYVETTLIQPVCCYIMSAKRINLIKTMTYFSLTPQKALSGTEDLVQVTSLEMCVDTQESTLGNFGERQSLVKQHALPFQSTTCVGPYCICIILQIDIYMFLHAVFEFIGDCI